MYFNLGNPNYKVKWIFSREAMTVFIRFSCRNDASFTFAHIQCVPGSPTQNGTNASIEFYAEYPGGGTMSQEILILIMSQQLDSIGSNVQLDLGLVTIIVPENSTSSNRRQHRQCRYCCIKRFRCGSGMFV